MRGSVRIGGTALLRLICRVHRAACRSLPSARADVMGVTPVTGSVDGLSTGHLAVTYPVTLDLLPLVPADTLLFDKTPPWNLLLPSF